MAKLKFRIGAKLGLSAAASVLLVVVMLANEQWSNANVARTNEDAATLLTTQTNTLRADGAMRGMQITGRDINLARTAAEIDKAEAGTRTQTAATLKHLDDALQGADAAQRERFTRAKQRVSDYGAALSELAAKRKASFDAQAEQTKLSTAFIVKYEAFLALPLLTELPAGRDIGALMRDGALNYADARIAFWRMLMTGQESYLPRIKARLAKSNELYNQARAAAAGTPLVAPIDELNKLTAGYWVSLEATQRADAAIETVLKERAFPARMEAEKILAEAVASTGARAAERRTDASEAMTQTGRVGLALGLIVMLVVSGSAVFSIVNIARPIRRIGEVLIELADGNKAVEIPYSERGDEVGDNARAAQIFKDQLLRVERLESEQKQVELGIAAQRKADMHTLADGFERAVGDIVTTVSSASTELESAAHALTKSAQSTQQLSGAVASASGEASTNVQTVASATDEMSSSVNEIGRQVQESSRIATEAVGQARNTDARIAELSRAAGRIGEVVKLISAVAQQTNLLALNATIEAARAGEAGRGFAVVASEVKALAAQTAQATEEISTQIAGMQTATEDSVNAIREIGGTIGRMSEIAGAIATAVEQQGAATQEISRNVAQAAHGVSQVAGNISDVNKGAAATGAASDQVLTSAQALSAQGGRLKAEVEKFLTTVRAA